jgi:hypothetical protein
MEPENNELQKLKVENVMLRQYLAMVEEVAIDLALGEKNKKYLQSVFDKIKI